MNNHLSLTSSQPISKLLRLMDLDQLQIYDSEGLSVIDYLGKTGLETQLTESDHYGDKDASISVDLGDTSLSQLNRLLNLSSTYNSFYESLTFPNVKLEAYATEAHDHEYLTLTSEVVAGGSLEGNWAFLGDTGALRELRLAVTLTHRSGSFRKDRQVMIEAQFELEGHQVNVYLDLATGHAGLWTLRFSDVNTGESDERTFTLQNLFKVFISEDNYEALPEGIKKATDFGLDELTIQFDPDRKELHQVSFSLTSGPDFSWDFIGSGEDASLALRNFELNLTAYPLQKNYQGTLHLGAKVGKLLATADLPIPLQGDLVFNVHTPEEEITLDDINGLMGGEDFSNHLPNASGIHDLTFNLSKLQVAWNLTESKLTAFDLQLSVTSDEDGYEIWENHLYLKSFDLELHLMQDQGWQSSGSIRSTALIEGTEVSVRLDKTVGDYWEVYLTDAVYFGKGLTGVTSLTATDLTQDDNGALPAKVEEVSPEEENRQTVLRQFRVHFDTQPSFKVSHVLVYLDTFGKTEIVRDKVTLLDASFLLEVDNPFDDYLLESAQLAGQLALGGHKVRLLSEKNGTNSHWTFSGKSQPGDEISITELFQVSLQAIGVNHIEEDQLPKVTIKDLDLTYVPDFQHLKFAGKSHLVITEKLEADFAVDLDYTGKTDEGEEQEGHMYFLGEGKIRVGKVIFSLTADYTTEKDEITDQIRGWSFVADMDGTVSLSDLLHDVLSLSGIDLPEAMPIDVSVSDVRFESIPTKKYYLLRGAAHLDTLNLSKDKGWQLSLDAKLEATRPEVTQSAPAQGLEYVVDAHAELDLIKNHDTGEKITLEMAAQTMADTEGWFLSGKMAENDSISLDQLVADLQEKLGIDASVPALLKDVEVNGLSATLNTATKDFAFSLDIDFRMMSQSVDLHADLNITHDQEGVPSKHFAGSMNLGSGEDLRVFDLKFDENEGRSWMLGSYVNKKGETVSLRQLIGTLMGTEVSIPDFWSVTLQDALVTYSGTDQKVLFITHLGNGIDLSNLPLVGRLFQGDQELTMNYQIAAASASFGQSDWQYVNPLLPKDIKPFESSTTIGKGLEITATLNVSGAVKQLELPIATEESAEPDPGNQDTLASTPPVRFSKSTATDDSVRWFNVQKNIGPVHIDRIGIKYDSEAEEPKLKFVLDASLNARGLTIELEGLSVSSPLTRLDPSFNLDGLAIDYKNKLIEIGAALLRDTIEDQVTGLVYDEYNGAAILRFKTLSIGAIGSYAYVDGHPSLFIYAALNMPLGGPAFFFVTGLSAGFGYNRKLIVPSVDKVLEFPLVAQAMGGKSLPEGAGKETLMEELDKIREYIPPSPGNVFLAAGLNFTTFKLIDSTVLLTAAFGEHTELNLLGVSTLSVPPNLGTGIKPLALVQMAIRGAFIPDEGFVGLSGQLTSNSYLFSENCHLTGGFAFHTWFSGEHAGDFVMTVGGYHPHFNVPAYYPTVPRVGIHWDLDERTQIKGEAYFALCAHAIMAGGKLEVNFEEGGLHAYLKAGANFLMSWEPFHYEAKMYTHVGGSYTYHFWGTHHISVDLGTEVELWGPEFGGKASLDLWITTIDIAFGSKKPAKPQALPNWQAFEDKFLPAQNHCQLMPLHGMVAEAAMDDSDALSTPSLGVFNAKHIGIGLETVVPSKLVNLKIAEGGQMPLSGNWNDQIGLSPMDVSRENFNCTLEIEIKYDGHHETDKFQFIPRTKSVPAALWSGNLTPQLNEESFVQEALMGLEIRLDKGTEEKKGTLINTSEASQATVKAIQWSSTDASDQLLSVRNDELQQLTVNDLTNHLDAVHDLAAAFGMDTKVDLSPDLMENWDLMANENNK